MANFNLTPEWFHELRELYPIEAGATASSEDDNELPPGAEEDAELRVDDGSGVSIDNHPREFLEPYPVVDATPSTSAFEGNYIKQSVEIWSDADWADIEEIMKEDGFALPPPIGKNEAVEARTSTAITEDNTLRELMQTWPDIDWTDAAAVLNELYEALPVIDGEQSDGTDGLEELLHCPIESLSNVEPQA